MEVVDIEEDGIINEDEDASGEERDERPVRTDPKSPCIKPNHNSTVLQSPTTSSVIFSPSSPGLSPISSCSDRTTCEVSTLSKKTLSKLGKFKRLEIEETVTATEGTRPVSASTCLSSTVTTSTSTTINNSKSGLKSSLARLAAKIQSRTVQQPVITGGGGLAEEEDLDFDLDL